MSPTPEETTVHHATASANPREIAIGISVFGAVFLAIAGITEIEGRDSTVFILIGVVVLLVALVIRLSALRVPRPRP